jgi:hypothetical protein
MRPASSFRFSHLCTPNVVPLTRGPLLAVAWSGGFGSRRLLYRANGNLIRITDGPYVIFGQRHHGLRVSGCAYELHLQAVRFIDFDYGAKISATQSVLRQVTV